jgi:hypothetical protein
LPASDPFRVIGTAWIPQVGDEVGADVAQDVQRAVLLQFADARRDSVGPGAMIAGGLLTLALLLPVGEADAAREAMANGDTHYARRAEGARAGTCAPFQVDSAIVDYRRALALDALSYAIQLRLLRAYFFRGSFCGLDEREQSAQFEEAKRLAERTVRQLDVDLSRRRGSVRGDAGARIPEAAPTYLWAAIAWGQWAVTHKVAAAWQGAAARIRDLAEAVIAIEPATEQAGAHVILGRLHAEAPRVPLLTHWISREKALVHLRAAHAIAPDSPHATYFLADALLHLSPTGRNEAIELLRRCATQPPRPEYPVEDAHYAEMAQQRLAGLR